MSHQNQKKYINFPIEVKENGIKRTLNDKDWKPIESEGGVIRIYDSEAKYKSFKDKKNINNFVLNYIYPKKNYSKKLFFKNKDNNCKLTEIETIKEEFDKKGNFIGFVNEFMNDSIFRKSSIKFPIKFSYLSEEENYRKKTEIAQNINRLNELFELNFSTKIIVQIQDNEPIIASSDIRIITYQEPGTGTNIIYFFKRIKNKWFLTNYQNLGI